jgi:3-isopropylmalate dehydrogenase
MSSNRKVLMLPGDGIGPEVMKETKKVIDWFDRRLEVGFDLEEGLVGGASYDKHKTPITEEVMEKALYSDGILFGAVGGPNYDNLPFSEKPERGLLRLRKELGLFANLRPAIVFDALADASSLKKEIVSGLDIMILRELTGGIYFGEPRGIEELADGSKIGVNTEVYSTKEIRRAGDVAFELAAKRRGLVHSVEKSNVMESGLLWREEIQKLHDEKYNNISLEHMFADNCAMQLVRDPHQFDVIVTTNLFGDLLSDISAQLTGSLGMLPSASLGEVNEYGIRKSLFEPVHGSAPDISGQGKANPIAMILSFAMMLRYSLDRNNDADLVEKAVTKALEDGLRTADIMQPGKTLISTEQMGAEICNRLDQLAV